MLVHLATHRCYKVFTIGRVSQTLWVQHTCTQLPYTVESFLKDHPIGHKNEVSQDRWSLVTG